MSSMVTAEMISDLVCFLDALGRETDERELAAIARRLEEFVRSGGLDGASVDRAVAQMVSAIKTGVAVNDASLRLGQLERGLAREGETLLIPASAHARGALGTRWRTDLVLTASGAVKAQVTIAILPREQANPEPDERLIEIDGGSVVVLEDALDTLFGFNGAAALRLTCEDGAVVATSRTYNLEGNLGSPDARTFGQFLPALSSDDAVVFGDEGRLLLLAHDSTLERGQRTNLILVNGGDEDVEVDIDLFTSDGVEIGDVEETLQAWEYRQFDAIFEEVTSGVVGDGYAVVDVETPGGRVFALASVVDNLTGDPVAVPAVRRSLFEETTLHETQIIQAAAKIEGVGDTDWRTDLVLHGLTGVMTTASVELLPRGQENTSPESTIMQIPQGQTVRYDDVLESLFSTDGAASIRVTPYGGAAGVESRTYNLLGEGNSGGYPAGATFGQYLGPVGKLDSITFGDEALIPHLSHDPSLIRGSRANLGLVNNSPRTIDVEIELFDGGGTLLGGFTQTLRMWENVQIGKVFDLGAGTAIGDGIFAAGTVGFGDTSTTDGTSVTGTVNLDFNEVAVDDRSPFVEDLELGFDLAQVGGDQVAGTVTLASSTMFKSATDFGGSLEFDTRICERYPIGGSITVTIGGEERTISFDSSCDGSFGIDIPSASFYSLNMAMNDCEGNPPGEEPPYIHMVDEDGQLSVDPSSPSATSGRARFAATGRVGSSGASVRFAQKGGSDGERRVGSFTGTQGEGGYWAGIYGYSVSDGECTSSYHHGRDAPDFSPGVLVACSGPCW